MDHFSELTPDRFLPALESALDKELTGLARPLSSYINRVYEIQAADGTFYIAKFYRPGRWFADALADEHQFLSDCEAAEIPVVCPCRLKNGTTLARLDKISFAIFPKKAGRQFDIESDESWRRVGTLLGRLHNVGQRQAAPARRMLSPEITARQDVEQLIEEAVTPSWQDGYRDICRRIIDLISPQFEGLETIRIHGDFHSGNILHRPGEGLMVIDFDDMMNGIPVQDFWLMLPDHYPASRPYLEKLLAGYRQFRETDHRWPLLIEGLRAMRMIYYTAWSSMQRSDYRFKTLHPEWGTDAFWAREVQDLRSQYAHIAEAMSI